MFTTLLAHPPFEFPPYSSLFNGSVIWHHPYLGFSPTNQKQPHKYFVGQTLFSEMASAIFALLLSLDRWDPAVTKNAQEVML
jgi:hypothetical protein